LKKDRKEIKEMERRNHKCKNKGKKQTGECEKDVVKEKTR
jgi:hypothetical protein